MKQRMLLLSTGKLDAVACNGMDMVMVGFSKIQVVHK